jgi:hypothetical protein
MCVCEEDAVHSLHLPFLSSLSSPSHSLNDNQIGDEACRALAEALKTNISLTWLGYVRV